MTRRRFPHEPDDWMPSLSCHFLNSLVTRGLVYLCISQPSHSQAFPADIFLLFWESKMTMFWFVRFTRANPIFLKNLSIVLPNSPKHSAEFPRQHPPKPIYTLCTASVISRFVLWVHSRLSFLTSNPKAYYDQEPCFIQVQISLVDMLGFVAVTKYTGETILNGKISFGLGDWVLSVYSYLPSISVGLG